MSKRRNVETSKRGHGETEAPRPRWAKELSKSQWTRINELLEDGYSAAEIARKVKLPQSKKRSLELHVRQWGPRRRLTKFAQFKDALLGNVEGFAGDFAGAITMLAKQAVDPAVKDATRIRAIEAMTNYTKLLQSVMGDDAKAEQLRQVEAKGRDGQVDPSDMVSRLLALYGVAGGGNGDA